MIRAILTIVTFISVIFFPWPLTAALALLSSPLSPLLPLAIGLFADTLYYIPQSGAWPLLTLYGAIVTCVAIIVRRKLRTGIINR